jgi:hypothetical protein
MCDTVLVKDVICETQQELADTIGIELTQLVLRGDYGKHIPNACLCMIDIEETAVKMGYKADVYYDAVADWKLVPNAKVNGGAAAEPQNGDKQNG